MSDTKSKLPDLKELSSMANKLFSDLKTSVSQIIKTYKENREQPEQNQQENEEPIKTTKTKSKPTQNATVEEDLTNDKDKK